jgi:hypothetical protein
MDGNGGVLVPEKNDKNKDTIITDKAELEKLLKQQMSVEKQAGDKPGDDGESVGVEPMCYDMGPPLE